MKQPHDMKNSDEVNKHKKSLSTFGYKSSLAAYRASVALDNIWHTASFCQGWQQAQGVTVCSVISWKWETQLVCQVAAYSYYNNRTEMLFVTHVQNQRSITLESRVGENYDWETETKTSLHLNYFSLCLGKDALECARNTIK